MRHGLGGTSLRENIHPDNPDDPGPELDSSHVDPAKALAVLDDNNADPSHGMNHYLDHSESDLRYYIEDDSPRHPLNQQTSRNPAQPNRRERPFVPIDVCSQCRKTLDTLRRWLCYKPKCGRVYCYDCAGQPSKDNLEVACPHCNTPRMTIHDELIPSPRTLDGIVQDIPGLSGWTVEQHERWLEEGQRFIRQEAS